MRCLFWVVVVGLAALIAFSWYAAPPQTTTLAVENMTCGTCPIGVKTALERVPRVTSTSVDFDTKTETVTFDPERATTARLTQATTTDAGFPSKLIAKA